MDVVPTDYRLQSGVLQCRECRLCDLREGYAVPAEVGAAYRRRVAFMCEAPGAQEDATGRPLVGRAGQLFDRILEAVGIERSECLLLNVVRCRPPRNRLGDYPDAVLACDPWTIKELTTYDPKLVVLMGATAIKQVFGNVLVGGIHGTFRHTGQTAPYGSRLWTATYHPASVFRTPDNYGTIVEDVRAALGIIR